MKTVAILSILSFQGILLSGQTLLKQVSLKKFGVAPANYSGIVRVAPDSFAIIDDKSAMDGFIPLRIVQDTLTGKVVQVRADTLRHDRPALPADKGRSRADCEDITYVPEWGTYFIASEAEQEIREYDNAGRRTGRRLNIPESFSPRHIRPGGGFESVTYNALTRLFWTTTETPTMSDGGATERPMMRFQSFAADLQPSSQWAYRMEAPSMKPGKYYAHGITALLALDDGRLLVMERELSVPPQYIGSKTQLRIFVVDSTTTEPILPTTVLKTLGEAQILKKRELFSFTTHIRPGTFNYGNYEGMAFGARLADGRQTLLLISDSQAGAGNGLYRLKDYIKVIILPENF